MKENTSKIDPYLTETVLKTRLDKALDVGFSEFEKKMDAKFDKKV